MHTSCHHHSVYLCADEALEKFFLTNELRLVAGTIYVVLVMQLLQTNIFSSYYYV
jgi:hypothetical protein